jgi:mono/diheme cytochrome c family protein
VGRSSLVAVISAVTLVALASACGDDGDVAAGSGDQGEALYQQSCALCHGADLRGTELGPSFLSQVYEPGHHPDASFRAAVAQGAVAHHWDFGDMPPVAGLTDDEVDDIIAFVREQQELHGFEPYPPP